MHAHDRAIENFAERNARLIVVLRKTMQYLHLRCGHHGHWRTCGDPLCRRAAGAIETPARAIARDDMH